MRGLFTQPRWASGCVKPLTPHGRWWTRGSPRYQVLSLWHPMLDTVEEKKKDQSRISPIKASKGDVQMSMTQKKH